MIPLALWPAWADRHCWDEDGDGRFYGAILSGDGWIAHEFPSTVPMPAGWDWRVPVMRPTVKDSLMVSPAIDLEQFRATIERAWKASRAGSEVDLSLGKLLALIDGQASVRSSSEHSSEAAANLVTDDAVRRLVRAMENTPGDDLIEPNTRLCRRLLVAALQPTKGEGE